MKPQLSAQGGDRRLSDSSEKGELDGLFLRIGNFALWQKTLITTVMNTISTCASESGGNRISEAQYISGGCLADE